LLIRILRLKHIVFLHSNSFIPSILLCFLRTFFDIAFIYLSFSCFYFFFFDQVSRELFFYLCIALIYRHFSKLSIIFLRLRFEYSSNVLRLRDKLASTPLQYRFDLDSIWLRDKSDITMRGKKGKEKKRVRKATNRQSLITLV
jgi:hypothetical protein